jgi:hypothetical protein
MIKDIITYSSTGKEPPGIGRLPATASCLAESAFEAPLGTKKSAVGARAG